MTYEYFIFVQDWWAFARTLQPKEHNALIRQIACYGLYGIAPIELCGDTLRYFNEVVRPDLDKQHEAHQRKANRQQPNEQ